MKKTTFHVSFKDKQTPHREVIADAPKLGEPLVTKFNDVTAEDTSMTDWWNLIGDMYQFFSTIKKEVQTLEEALDTYGGELPVAILRNYNDDELVAEWKIGKAYIKSVNFGCLDYSSSETCDLELTWGFFELERTT